MAESKPSRSSRALAALLKDRDVSKKLQTGDGNDKDAVHRTLLWHYANGTKRPTAETAAKMERLTDGAVPANGWEDDAEIEHTNGDAA